MSKDKIIINPTPADIKAWKEKYDTVFKYTAKDGVTAYFRAPEIAELDAAAAIASQPVKSNLVILKACFIGGDERVITEKQYLVGVWPKMQQIIKRVEGEFSEL